MKKAKIYIPTKTALQSGKGKIKNWILKFKTKDTKTNPLMGWESGEDTLKEVILEFSSKEKAIKYAKSNNIDYEIVKDIYGSDILIFDKEYTIYQSNTTTDFKPCIFEWVYLAREESKSKLTVRRKFPKSHTQKL